MTHLTFSSLNRIRHCLASGVLPQTHSESEASALGTVIHLFLSLVPSLGREEALEQIPDEHRAACAAIELEQLPAMLPERYSFETPCAINPITGSARLLPKDRKHRDYSAATSDEIPGTVDVVGRSGEEVVVLDYKTGRADLGPVHQNLQLTVAALAMARIFNVKRAFVGVIRIHSDGSAHWDTAQLSEEDMDAVAFELAQLALDWRASKKSPEKIEPIEGAWCAHCPAFVNCPAKARLAVQLGQGLPGWSEASPLNDSTAIAALERIAAAQEVLDKVSSIIREYANSHPLDLGNGWVYGAKEHPEETISNPVAARGLIEQIFNAEVATAAIQTKVSMTKVALREALKEYWAKRHGAKVVGKVFESAMALLREKGYATTKTSVRIMKFRQKKLTVGETPLIDKENE